MRRNENGDWTTDDQRFEVKSNGHGRWVLTAKDEDAEAALRSTAHLRPYGRLGDAENWIFAAVYPHLRGEPLNADAAKLQMKMRYASLLYAEFSASESCGALQLGPCAGASSTRVCVARTTADSRGRSVEAASARADVTARAASI